MSTAHSSSTSIHTVGHFAPFGHNTQRDRQTDRAIGTGRLCYSIGGLTSKTRTTDECSEAMISYIRRQWHVACMESVSGPSEITESAKSSYTLYNTQLRVVPSSISHNTVIVQQLGCCTLYCTVEGDARSKTRKPANWWGSAKRDLTHPTATAFSGSKRKNV